MQDETHETHVSKTETPSHLSPHVASDTSRRKDLGGRPITMLTENQCRYAMSCTYSNRSASAFLNVSYNTWKKYSSMYTDEITGKTLFELQLASKPPKEPTRYPDRAYHCNSGYKEKLEDILDGRYPGYPVKSLRKRLFLSGWVPMVCNSCGWDEPRVTDGNYPMLIDFIDTNWRNCELSNLRLLCFNCYFNQVRTPSSSWQGWTYGTATKKHRWDGKPKGYGTTKYKELHGLDPMKYPERRRKQIQQWYDGLDQNYLLGDLTTNRFGYVEKKEEDQ